MLSVLASVGLIGGAAGTAHAASDTSGTAEPSEINLSVQSGTYIGQPVAIEGTLLADQGSLPSIPGQPLTVTRTNPDGTTTSLPSAQSGTNGGFEIDDQAVPAVGETETYTVSYAGDAEYQPASATVTITPKVYTVGIYWDWADTAPWSRNTVGVTLVAGIGGNSPDSSFPVTVSRLNPDGTTTTLPTVQAPATGTFTIKDKPTELGTYTYTLSYAGSAHNSPATASLQMPVQAIPDLTLTVSPGSVSYRAWVTVTAHLGSSGSNRTLSIYAASELPGGNYANPRLLTSAAVDAHGNLAVRYLASQNVQFSVSFAADSQYQSWEVFKSLNVAATVKASIHGYFKSSEYDGELYRVYHHTARLEAVATVAPNTQGRQLVYVVQRLRGGKWVSYKTYNPLGIPKSSTVTTYLALGGETGGRYRIRAIDQSVWDMSHATGSSAWLYYQVVS